MRGDRQLMMKNEKRVKQSILKEQRRRLTIARLTVVMTLLTPELGLEESLGALGMALARCQLPGWRAFDTLVTARTTACITAQITFNATATIAVIAENDKIHNEYDNFVVKVCCRVGGPVMMNF